MSLISDERAEELLANEKEKDAEIERLKAHIEATRTLEIFQNHQREFHELKTLLARAADALESNQIATSTSCEIFTLIDELRKAAF